MTDRELLEFIAGQIGTLTLNVDNLTKDVFELKSGQSNLKCELGSVKSELGDLKRIVVDLENDHGKKLTLLLDGYKQNADKLDRIEKEVSKPEEIIFRRVK